MIYDLPNGVKMVVEEDVEPYGYRGRLCTLKDPDGKICQVIGCNELEAIGVLFKMYHKLIKKEVQICRVVE